MSTADKDVEQRPDSKNGSGSEKNDEQPPNCLAQADVKTPWLDINARFQLRSNSREETKKKEKTDKSARPSFFSLPKFKTKGASKSNGNGNKNGNGKAAEGSTTADGAAAGGEEWQDLTVPKKRQIWQGWEGLAITIFGIAMPALVIMLSCISMPKRLTLVILNHPLETIAELLLLVSIPLANYIVWSAICNNNLRYSLRRGISLGGSIASCLIVAGICIAGIFAGSVGLESEIGSDFAGGFTGLALMAVIAGGVSAYLVNRIRLTRDFKNSRAQVMAFTAIGAVLSLVTVLGAEFRPWSIRLAEKKAASTSTSERKIGLKELRALDPERELLMECSDQKAAGISGLFIPLKSSSQHELYFALTGKPYSFNDISDSKDFSSMPDDYLSRHVVGERIPGLTMRRSYLSGIVHSKTLSSTIEWTYVFKNDSSSASQEARAEIGLPPGAVITGLKLWKKGEAVDAKFVASGKAEGAAGFTEVGHDSPAIVSDLGHGRALLHCYPINQNEEVKLQLTMVMPLKADGDKTASLSLPKFIATNFELSGDHLLRLRSDKNITSTVKNLKTGSSPGGQRAISGILTPKQLENSSLILSAERSPNLAPIVVLDKLAIKMEQQDARAKELLRRKNAHNTRPQEQVVVMIDGSKGIQSQFDNLRKVMAMKAAGTNHGHAAKKRIKTIQPKYVLQKVVLTSAPAPKELVIVVDGSASMQAHIKDLTEALNRLPKGIPAHLIVASQEHPEMLQPMLLKDALPKLQTMTFAGGQDNLQAVVKAAEIAGETKGGAVLWAHGPLPVLNEEIYIMPPYVAAPTFYELPLGSGETDTYDFFKNHTEIGPFLSVPRNTTEMVNDLGAFFSKWKLDQNGYAVSLTQTSAKPDKSVLATPAEETELLALHANEQIAALLNTRHITKAARIAVEYGLLSPVSCALIQENSNDNVDTADSTDNGNDTSVTTDADKTNSTETETLAEGEESKNEALSGKAPPALQGATNGTIGPQGADATYVTGVNTAGTVRVNNLANLEALLNIFANLFEVGGALIGAIIILHSLANKSFAMEMMGQELEISQGQRIAIGVALLLFGLAFPGLVNWFVASARDANLFS